MERIIINVDGRENDKHREPVGRQCACGRMDPLPWVGENEIEGHIPHYIMTMMSILPDLLDRIRKKKKLETICHSFELKQDKKA